MKEKNRSSSKKNVSLIAIILAIVVIVTLSTFALMIWTSGEENTELTMRIGEIAEVIFPPLEDEETDGITVSGNHVTISGMGPVFNYEEDGGIVKFQIINLTNNEITTNAILQITSISDNLKEEDFRVAVFFSDDDTTYTEISNTSFVNSSAGSNLTLFSEFALTGTGYYKVSFYIDGNKLNSNTLQGGSLEGIINVSAYDISDYTDLFVNNTTVNGSSFFGFPTGNYNVSVNCSGATATFDYETQHLMITSVSIEEKATCNTSFTEKETTTYLNEHVISLSGQTQGTGSVVSENGYRYEGENPNNYVKFNNELWRIIGVFDENSHGVEGEYLTKIIRDSSIGGIVWDKNSSNNWADSSLNKLLNGPYYNYNSTDSASIVSENCYISGSTITGTCDYSVIGVQDEYRDMLKNVTWYLGGSSSNAITADEFYGYERSTSDDDYYSSNVDYKTVKGYIGLIYPSDYGYSVLASSCARDTSLSSYNTDACAGNSWLKKESYEWTMTHNNSATDGVFQIFYTRDIRSSTVTNAFNVRPTLYLDSSVYIISGNGSLTNPYILNN